MDSERPLSKFTNRKAANRFNVYVDYHVDDKKLLDYLQLNRKKYGLTNVTFSKWKDVHSPGDPFLSSRILKDFIREHPQDVENNYDRFLNQEGRNKRHLIDIPDPAYEDGDFELQQLVYEIIKSSHLPSLKAALSSLEVDLDWIVQKYTFNPLSQYDRQGRRLLASIEKIAAVIAGADSSEQVLYNHSVSVLSKAVQEIYKELIKHIAKHPKTLYKIAPRQFEELIAEILSSFGWTVELTKESRDGGCDIIAVSKDINAGIKATHIIECKKYSPDRKVGIAVARQILHVKDNLKASNAVLVTTSDFTKGVYDYSIDRMDFDLKNFEAIIEWCRLYDKKKG